MVVRSPLATPGDMRLSETTEKPCSIAHTYHSSAKSRITLSMRSTCRLPTSTITVSAFLAGVRRSTGLTVKPDSFSENPSAQKWFENYLWVGETVMDQSVALFGASSYFERKR
ncbi:DUF1748 domain containing protein [Pyrenophora tritici-repentis]|uniref:Duf1748 domain containing protein n=1 Tax=Pyrenophora tritici-repentis TaxID=45151 RepID=A0A922N4Z5_9PLEO|nr:DUF1748 domain-containing protein [Pyrenophora tritici-repentis]KAI1511399.1 duf1748 domain containing protein [Pyrenophora tritici-repentis]KAI1667376.1 duf1748 domain containing protein [Pyrenophora tritici-repentis]KAI1679573.1 duf1748 domain containing protein [Pyrenophora tritici-repentis]KAI2476177.1 DUF1748 domain containing protein [Pyrenophora tritici-repentis]